MGKVLIIDDNANLCELWAFLLEDQGHAVITAADGLTALRVYDRQRPDVVITDMELPGLDGLGIIARLRAARPDAKIIAMSGSARSLQAARSLGVTIALRKPVGATEMVAAIRWTLRDRQRNTA
jgi:two-component system, OmpR family, response regulator